MRNLTTKLILASVVIVAVIGLVSTLTVDKKEAVAKRFYLKDNGIYSISETLGEKRVVNDPEMKILFDRKKGKLLVAKGWVGPENSVEQSGGTNLWMMDESGANATELTTGYNVVSAFMSQDGRAFYSTKNQDLFVIDYSKLNSKKKITEKALSPNLSSDGRYLAYQKLNHGWRPDDYTEQALGIAILDITTGNEKQISNVAEDFNPLWMPDGKRILFFSRSPEGLVSFFVMDSDGTKRAQLTNVGKKFFDEQAIGNPSEKPIWSSNGKYLVYESDRVIWVLEFSRNYQKIVSSKKVAYGRDPEWVIDGQTFTVVVTPQQNPSTTNIMEFDVSGKYKQTL